MRVLAVLAALAALVLGACQSPRLVPATAPTASLGLAPALTAPPVPPSVEVLQTMRPAPAASTTIERHVVRPGLRTPYTPATPVAFAPRFDRSCTGGT